MGKPLHTEVRLGEIVVTPHRPAERLPLVGSNIVGVYVFVVIQCLMWILLITVPYGDFLLSVPLQFAQHVAGFTLSVMLYLNLRRTERANSRAWYAWVLVCAAIGSLGSRALIEGSADLMKLIILIGTLVTLAEWLVRRSRTAQDSGTV